MYLPLSFQWVQSATGLAVLKREANGWTLSVLCTTLLVSVSPDVILWLTGLKAPVNQLIAAQKYFYLPINNNRKLEVGVNGPVRVCMYLIIWEAWGCRWMHCNINDVYCVQSHQMWHTRCDKPIRCVRHLIRCDIPIVEFRGIVACVETECMVSYCWTRDCDVLLAWCLPAFYWNKHWTTLTSPIFLYEYACVCVCCGFSAGFRQSPQIVNMGL